MNNASLVRIELSLNQVLKFRRLARAGCGRERLPHRGRRPQGPGHGGPPARDLAGLSAYFCIFDILPQPLVF